MALGAVALLALSAYLAATETVVSRLNMVRALRLAEEDHRGADALLWLTEHRASVLNVVLVATVAGRVVLVVLAIGLGTALVDGLVGVAVGAVAAVLGSLLLGEVAPRTVALRHIEATGLRLAPSARALVRGLSPLVVPVIAAGRALVPSRDEVSGPYAPDDELRASEGDGEDQLELEPEERAMIRSIFELADTRVREIMVPRPDMVTLSADDSFDTLVATIVERGYSRLPVHSPEDPDAIVGVVYAKDLLHRLAEEPQRRQWDDLVRRPTFVPETKRGDDLLRELQERMVHLALVVDEYGELVGLVTIEDILEEIVGEIVDEHDQEAPLVEPLGGGVLRVDARFGVGDLNDLLGTELPEEGWDTVGGLVVATLGRVPDEGERIELEGASITVELVQGRRVGKVLVTPDRPDWEVRSGGGDDESPMTSTDGVAAAGRRSPRGGQA